VLFSIILKDVVLMLLSLLLCTLCNNVTHTQLIQHHGNIRINGACKYKKKLMYKHKNITYYIIMHSYITAHGRVVVEALSYNPEGRGIVSR
jgi:hypothetical protein